ncbi:ABC transporter permease [Halobacterium yunchengense]|uniref:ABC transporter permease n=1 Tax=Halobacterium yunchengense TaxID=3108497 RepID=UPI0030083A10
MSPSRLPTAAHVALADFRQRARSRRLLAVLAAFAYTGYQINVGTFDLFYEGTVAGEAVDYHGELTAAYVGLSTGVMAATILLFFGYYVLSGSIARDAETGVDELTASTPITATAYLAGKWLSHVALVAVLLATFGCAALVNHAVHGVGPTDPVWIIGAVFLVALPLGCLVAGVTVLFQSTRRLDGTLGNIAYLFGAMTVLTAILSTASTASGSVPLWLRLGDLVGLIAAGEMTVDALLTVAPTYSGPPIANYGTGVASTEIVRYHWTGSPWPNWFFASRLGMLLVAGGAVLAATVPYRRFAGDTGTGRHRLTDRVKRVLPSLSSEATPENTGVQSIENRSLTPISDRAAGGFGRLLGQELRLLLRGHEWWWYGGAVAISGAAVAGTVDPTFVVPIAAVWPLFVWSGMGYRTVHHGVTPLVLSSKRPLRQLAAEWAAGAVVTAAFLAAPLWPTIADAGASGIVVLAGAVLFIPSLAQCAGLWSGTRRAFELAYLVLWYLGPLNGVGPLDFAGATTETVGTATPLLFGGVGVAALLGAAAHRYLQTQ